LEYLRIPKPVVLVQMLPTKRQWIR